MIGIIGGSGFIGTRLVKRLLIENRKIKIIDKNPSKEYNDLWVYADVRNIDTLYQTLRGCKIIYNLAAEHGDNVKPKSLYYDVNVKGAENVCKVMQKLNIKKLIFTSSVAVYGFSKNDTCEHDELKPYNDYGKTKQLAEGIYLNWYNKTENSTLTIIRPTVVFGENNRGNVYNLFKQVIEGKFIMIGTGHNKKSMAYIENVASFLEYLIKFRNGLYIFNYADKPDLTMNELIKIIQDNMRLNSKILKLPYWIGYSGGLFFDTLSLFTRKEYIVSSIRVKKFCENTVFSSKNIAETDFKPPIDLLLGIKKTLQSEFNC